MIHCPSFPIVITTPSENRSNSYLKVEKSLWPPEAIAKVCSKKGTLHVAVGNKVADLLGFTPPNFGRDNFKSSKVNASKNKYPIEAMGEVVEDQSKNIGCPVEGKEAVELLDMMRIQTQIRRSEHELPVSCLYLSMRALLKIVC